MMMAKTSKSERESSVGESKYREWYAFESEERIPVTLNRLSDELVVLGVATAIMYRSDKWQKGSQEDYLHDFAKRHPPLLVYDPANEMLLIIGGKYRVTADGIVG